MYNTKEAMLADLNGRLAHAESIGNEEAVERINAAIARVHDGRTDAENVALAAKIHAEADAALWKITAENRKAELERLRVEIEIYRNLVAGARRGGKRGFWGRMFGWLR